MLDFVTDISELEQNASLATALLKSMANERRLLILCHLANGEKTVGELERVIGVSQSALSQHLAILRREDLVATRRSAQSIYYSIAEGKATSMMDTLYDIYCGAIEAAANGGRELVDAAE
ncbi:MAG: winged helix-turn-helix transcriptional regulator [Hyphomicrobiales bacterium]|nr:winged helix-turn-helix transcriptional regulator [Hyphomicrobiales bacterium]